MEFVSTFRLCIEMSVSSGIHNRPYKCSYQVDISRNVFPLSSMPMNVRVKFHTKYILRNALEKCHHA